MGEGSEESIGVGLGPWEEEKHGRGTFTFRSPECCEDPFEVVLMGEF